MSTSDMTTRAILAAYKRLPAQERSKIDRLAETLRARIRRSSPGGKGLGKQAALELIGKLGIFLEKHTPGTRPAEASDAAGQHSPSHRGHRRAKHV